MSHSAAIQAQSWIVASFAPRRRARQKAFCQPECHQSGIVLSVDWQRRSISAYFSWAALRMDWSIAAASGIRTKVFSAVAIWLSQRWTHWPVAALHGLVSSSRPSTPRYFFNQTSAGLFTRASNSLTLGTGTRAAGDRSANSY